MTSRSILHLLRDRAIEISDRFEQAVAEPVMSGGVVWIERDRLFKFTHRQRSVEIEYVRQNRQIGVRLGEVRIERDRFVCRFFRLWICVRRICAAEKWQQNVNVGYTRPRQRVFRIQSSGFSKITERFLKIGSVSLVPKEAAP